MPAPGTQGSSLEEGLYTELNERHSDAGNGQSGGRQHKGLQDLRRV